ncbi:MAG: hypothetical protein JNL09_10395 [Anaerolineales bacterium]|nr:hypothetical protein [Anaerolineales bacterium]
MKPETERDAYAQIDAALRVHPLAQPPATLAPAVLARLRQISVNAARPRFRLTTFDFLWPIVGTLMVAAMWITLTMPTLTPSTQFTQELAYMQLQARWLWLYVQPYLPVTLSGWFGLIVLCGSAFMGLVVVALRPWWAHTRFVK